MSLTPVTSYKQPRYPERQIFTDNPSLFNEFIPQRWNGIKITAGALATALLGGCASSTTEPDVPLKGHSENHMVDDSLEIFSPSEVKVESQEQFHVAPLFLHGEGKGATGCEMIAPPVFLSEAEAYDVIVQTLEKYGITLDTDTVIFFPEALLPRIGFTFDSLTEKCAIDTVGNIQLQLGGYDASKKIGVKFISTSTYRDMRRDYMCECNDEGILRCATVWSYKMIDVAVEFVDCLRRLKAFHGGVFYDPCPKIDHEAFIKASDDDERETIYQETRQRSLDLLKKQVIDFAKYLRDKGLITPLSIRKKQ